MADEKAKIVTDATGPSSGPAPAQPEVDAQVSKQEQSAPEAPTPDIIIRNVEHSMTKRTIRTYL